jgi:hypothetical protein
MNEQKMVELIKDKQLITNLFAFLNKNFCLETVFVIENLVKSE